MYNNREYTPTRIAGATTSQIFTGRGNLGGICINTATAVGTITVKDSADGGTSGTTIGVLASTVASGRYLQDILISSGLVIVTAGASDLTVLTTKG